MNGDETSLALLVMRSATLADADALSRFAAKSFRDTFEGTASTEEIEAYVLEAYSPVVQAAEITDSRARLFLAEQQNVSGAILVGFAHLIVDGTPDAMELKRIYVDTAWQGRGLARRLLDQALDECRHRGVRRLWLSVWHRNERAIAFYLKSGFRISGDMSFDWGDDAEAGLLMERTVS